MSEADHSPGSVLGSLGIDVDSDSVPISDDVWQAMLDSAFDPDTPLADSSTVPVMDDAGDLPDDGVDDTQLASYDPDAHAHGDGALADHHADEIDLGIEHDAAPEHHHDPAVHDVDNDHSTDHHGYGDNDWHV